MLIGFGLVRLEDIVEPSASLRFKCTLEKIQTHAPKFLKSLKMYAVHSSPPGKKRFERKPKILHTHDERI